MSEGHKQNILMVHNYYQIPGGEDTVVANEKKLLEDHGHKVILYTRHNDEIKEMSIVKKLFLPFITIFNTKTYKDIKKIIREQNIEIVHVHNTLSLISPAVYYAAVKCGVPVVQTIHNFRFLCPGATFYRDGHICEECVSKGLWCAIKHKCYRNSRVQTLICVVNTLVHRHSGILKKITFIALTDFNKCKMMRLKHIDPQKIYVKPNFTYDMVVSEKVGKREKYLYVGRIEEIKGVREIISFFQNMPQCILELAGDGPLLKELEQVVEEKKSRNIFFLGRIDHLLVMKKMEEAKAVVLLSRVYEGFPMTMVEAYSVGTPVVGSNFGNVGSLIEDGVTGYKTELSEIEFKKAISKIESNSIQNSSVRLRYLSLYTPETAYTLLYKIYMEA